jgi:hypothetical protein
MARRLVVWEWFDVVCLMRRVGWQHGYSRCCNAREKHINSAVGFQSASLGMCVLRLVVLEKVGRGLNLVQLRRGGLYLFVGLALPPLACALAIFFDLTWEVANLTVRSCMS